MFPGEIPGRSRLVLLGRRRGSDRVFRNGRRRFVTKVNHFYNGPDLYVGANGRIWARAMGGDFEVDLIYRRVEDLELFVPGLTDAYLEHKVVLVNALGTGACDDKLVFLRVPEMIDRYLGEAPILEQAVSYDLRSTENRQYVLQNLDKLVLKTRQGYGGLGVFIMPDLRLTYRNRLAQQLIE